MRDPTAELVLERMKGFEKGHVPGSAEARAAAEGRHHGTGA
jgi:putative ABC transport system ATP-binding protein